MVPSSPFRAPTVRLVLNILSPVSGSFGRRSLVVVVVWFEIDELNCGLFAAVCDIGSAARGNNELARLGAISCRPMLSYDAIGRLLEASLALMFCSWRSVCALLGDGAKLFA